MSDVLEGSDDALPPGVSRAPICARSWTDIAAHALQPNDTGGGADPLFEALAVQALTAELNFAAGTVASGALLASLGEAYALLRAHCASGAAAQRHAWHRLLGILGDFNGGATAELSLLPSLPRRERANFAFCGASSAFGAYDIASDACQCAPGRFGADCSARTCNEHGSAHGAEPCSCFWGWQGDSCARCAHSPQPHRATYLCVGLDQRVPLGGDGDTGAALSHALTLVQTRSVSARLTAAPAWTAGAARRPPPARCMAAPPV
jgi:hypothetical protein